MRASSLHETSPVKTGSSAPYDGRATDLEADRCGLGIVVSAASTAPYIRSDRWAWNP